MRLIPELARPDREPPICDDGCIHDLDRLDHKIFR